MIKGTKKLAALLAASIFGSALTLSASGVFGKSSFIKSGEMSGVTREETGSLLNENYYAYINFDRLRSETIPYGESYKPLADDRAEEACLEILRGLREHTGEFARGTNEQKITDICEQLFDEELRGSVGIAPLEGILAKIEGADSINGLISIAAELQHDYGVETFIKFNIRHGIYDSSKYAVIHSQIAMPAEPEEFFTKYGLADSIQKGIKDIIDMRGGENSSERARRTVDLLYEIADNSMNSFDIFYAVDDYREMTLSEFAALFSADVSPYTNMIAERCCGRITIADVGQLYTEARLLTDENLQAWKDYAVTMTLLKYADYLPESTVRVLAPFEKVYKLPDEETVSAFFDKELAYIFAQKYADYELIGSARKFTADIIAAYERLIKNSPSADDATKVRFVNKLQNMSVNICVPDEPYDGNYDVVPTAEGGDLLSNAMRKFSGEFRKKLDNIGKPFDKTAYDWDGMPPQVYGNAQYQPANYVTIPYATLWEPYFNPDGDLYKNLGYLGFVIGHEISHGFDSYGIKYNEYGNYDPSWIGGEFGAALAQKKADITELYNRQKLFGVYPLDGAKTLGENMADIASVQCMLSMANTPEQKQTFMENYARFWYTLMYDTAAYEQLYNDEHALNEFRANVVLSQMDEFYEVYGITDGKMFTAPEDRRKVW